MMTHGGSGRSCEAHGPTGIRVTAMAALVFCLACRSHDYVEPTDSTGTVVNSLCGFYDRCAVENGKVYGSLQECMDLIVRLSFGQCGGFELTNSNAASEACSQFVDGLSCADQVRIEAPGSPCRELTWQPDGANKMGESCESSSGCEVGAFCQTDDDPAPPAYCETCVAAEDLRDPWCSGLLGGCPSDATCGLGRSECVMSSGSMPLANGAVCSGADSACQSGWCKYGSSGWTCEQPLPRGATCEPSDRCEKNLACQSAKCGDRLSEGEACDDFFSDYNPCLEGFVCILSSCQREALCGTGTLNQACLNDRGCEKGLLCAGYRTCVARPHSGEACTIIYGEDNCADGQHCNLVSHVCDADGYFCSATSCIAVKSFGQPCEVANLGQDCDTGVCDATTAPPTCGSQPACQSR